MILHQNIKTKDGRVTTRVDTGKSIDSLATIITWILFGLFILLWKIFKYIFLKKQDIATKGSSIIVKIVTFLLITIVVLGTLGSIISSPLFETKTETRKMTSLEKTFHNVNYENIRNRLSEERFANIYADNNNKLLTQLKKNKSSQIDIFFSGGKESIGEDLEIDTIEEVRAMKAVYGKDYSLKTNELKKIVEQLGNLDKGYSKKLASFFNDFMDRKLLISMGYDFHKQLKKNNQTSALRVYMKLKKKYNIPWKN